MRRSGRLSSSSTVTYTFQNDNSTPTIDIPITVQLQPSSSSAAAAIKIQSAYRSHLIRKLIKTISSVHSESNRIERLIQNQETVDAVRRNDQERIRINEALMSLLLKLDSVPGIDPTVRELRRSTSRGIVALQEILDGVCGSNVQNWDGFLREWDEAIEEMEQNICVEKGGHEMEKFCADYLGFRCLQRFLSDN